MDWPQTQTRLFRALLYCYPAEFRHEYSAEMEQLFADRLRAEPHWRLWLETFADLAISAPVEHWNILIADRVMACVSWPPRRDLRPLRCW